MKAVEWLTNKLRVEFGFAFSDNILEQAKVIEQNQNKQFAIEFAEWMITFEDVLFDENNTIKEVFEIYKKEIKTK